MYEPWIGRPELARVVRCVKSGWISSIGAEIGEFEARFAALCARRFGVATSNGTTALHLALAALGIGPGDEVIVPALTFVATANAVHYTGATPVFADADPVTWNVDPAAVAKSVTRRTRAILAVHLYGQPADMRALASTARRAGAVLVEDAAEAHGARYHGRPVGSLGAVACFSFYGNKMVTTGEGGMVLTSDAKLAARLRLLRDHAMSPKRRYYHTEIGFNYRMTTLQAALGLAQLDRFEEICRRKQRIAAWYRDGLRGLPLELAARRAGQRERPLDVQRAHPPRRAPRPRRVRTPLACPRHRLAPVLRADSRASALPRAWHLPGSGRPRHPWCQPALGPTALPPRRALHLR